MSSPSVRLTVIRLRVVRQVFCRCSVTIQKPVLTLYFQPICRSATLDFNVCVWDPPYCALFRRFLYLFSNCVWVPAWLGNNAVSIFWTRGSIRPRKHYRSFHSHHISWYRNWFWVALFVYLLKNSSSYPEHNRAGPIGKSVPNVSYYP